MIQSSLQTFPLTLEPLEPLVGLEFESAEDTREFYERYIRRMRFTIRNNRTRRSLKDNSIVGREFVCLKEGFRIEKYAKRQNRVLCSRQATRDGFNASMRIGSKDGAKRVVREHSHELNPNKIPPRRSHRLAFYEVSLQVMLWKMVLIVRTLIYIVSKVFLI